MSSFGGADARAGSSGAAKALGGNVTGAWLVDGTVRRPTGPWTTSVHGVLDHLADCGVDAVPRVLGVDDEGREVLGWIEGSTVAVPASDGVLRSMGRLLRRLHDAIASMDVPDDARWRGSPSGPPGPGSIVCHRDLQPSNALVRGGEVVGIIDWDLAGPSSVAADVGFVLWAWIPLAHGDGLSGLSSAVPSWCASVRRRAPLRGTAGRRRRERQRAAGT
jgi:Ser/Thr protein kinase RdoA (MazF antagonist)